VGGRHLLWGPNFSEHLLLEAVPRYPFYPFSFQRLCLVFKFALFVPTSLFPFKLPHFVLE
jgi:hypothetical protein